MPENIRVVQTEADETGCSWRRASFAATVAIRQANYGQK